jgi:hypothetical protein
MKPASFRSHFSSLALLIMNIYLPKSVRKTDRIAYVATATVAVTLLTLHQSAPYEVLLTLKYRLTTVV